MEPAQLRKGRGEIRRHPFRPPQGTGRNVKEEIGNRKEEIGLLGAPNQIISSFLFFSFLFHSPGVDFPLKPLQ
jgi:hypothetical protein